MMNIDRLNAAAWAAGFAMAPVDDEPEMAPAREVETVPAEAATSRWRSARVPSRELVPVEPSAMRQWLSSWQRKATA